MSIEEVNRKMEISLIQMKNITSMLDLTLSLKTYSEAMGEFRQVRERLYHGGISYEEIQAMIPHLERHNLLMKVMGDNLQKLREYSK